MLYRILFWKRSSVFTGLTKEIIPCRASPTPKLSLPQHKIFHLWHKLCHMLPCSRISRARPKLPCERLERFEDSGFQRLKGRRFIPIPSALHTANPKMSTLGRSSSNRSCRNSSSCSSRVKPYGLLVASERQRDRERDRDRAMINVVVGVVIGGRAGCCCCCCCCCCYCYCY